MVFLCPPYSCVTLCTNQFLLSSSCTPPVTSGNSPSASFRCRYLDVSQNDIASIDATQLAKRPANKCEGYMRWGRGWRKVDQHSSCRRTDSCQFDVNNEECDNGGTAGKTLLLLGQNPACAGGLSPGGNNTHSYEVVCESQCAAGCWSREWAPLRDAWRSSDMIDEDIGDEWIFPARVGPSLANGVCNAACNTLACGFDGGDCILDSH